tara:strand:- start:890 stop:1081 length:192 start_codon:yes stop_codon:yes gene_type:complete
MPEMPGSDGKAHGEAWREYWEGVFWLQGISQVPGDRWCFVIAITKLSNDYGAIRVLAQRGALN